MVFRVSEEGVKIVLVILHIFVLHSLDITSLYETMWMYAVRLKFEQYMHNTE